MSNIDQSEINKFNQHHNTWWDKNGEFKPLHIINPLRIEHVQKFTSLATKKILDIGCGGGIFAISAAQQKAQVTAIDAAEKAIAAAQTYLATTKLDIDYQVNTIENLTAAVSNKPTYDIITCWEVLEHVPNPQMLIEHALKLLKPGGHIFFSTLNRHPLAYLAGILVAEYLLKILPKGTHDYAKFICPAELATWLEIKQLKVEDIVGVAYNPFYHTAKFTSNVNINYFICAQQKN